MIRARFDEAKRLLVELESDFTGLSADLTTFHDFICNHSLPNIAVEDKIADIRTRYNTLLEIVRWLAEETMVGIAPILTLATVDLTEVRQLLLAISETIDKQCAVKLKKDQLKKAADAIQLIKSPRNDLDPHLRELIDRTKILTHEVDGLQMTDSEWEQGRVAKEIEQIERLVEFVRIKTLGNMSAADRDAAIEELSTKFSPLIAFKALAPDEWELIPDSMNLLKTPTASDQRSTTCGEMQSAEIHQVDGEEGRQLHWDEAILKVLKEADEPLSYSEIAKRIIGQKLRKTVGLTPETAVGSILSMSISNHGTASPFRRVARGQYSVNPSINQRSTTCTRTSFTNSKPTSEGLADNNSLGTQDIDPDAVIELPLSTGSIPRFDDESASSDTDEIYYESFPNGFEPEFKFLTCCGIYWSRKLVNWGKNTVLAGISPSGELIDFSKQTGIYLLYQDYNLVWIGLTTESGLLTSLLAHTKDKLEFTWDSFSWFGFATAETAIPYTEYDNSATRRVFLQEILAFAVLISSPSNQRNWISFTLDTIRRDQSIDPELRACEAPISENSCASSEIRRRPPSAEASPAVTRLPTKPNDNFSAAEPQIAISSQPNIAGQMEPLMPCDAPRSSTAPHHTQPSSTIIAGEDSVVRYSRCEIGDELGNNAEEKLIRLGNSLLGNSSNADDSSMRFISIASPGSPLYKAFIGSREGDEFEIDILDKGRTASSFAVKVLEIIDYKELADEPCKNLL